MTRKERDALVARHDSLWVELQGGLADESIDGPGAGEIRNAMRALRGEYFAALPRVELSRCPVCGEAFRHSFDPWGVDGFWWQEDAARKTPEPATCPHFGVLQGALHLNGQPPHGGLAYEAMVGPGVPFVIPRVLQQRPVVAVVSSFPLANGYRAFPIVYYTREPLPPGSFTQPWTRTSYSYRDPRGGFAWRVDTDPWDFDLEPWVRADKLLWTEPGDTELHVRSRRSGACPYNDLEGVRERQFLQADRYRTLPPPAGESVDPFHE